MANEVSSLIFAASSEAEETSRLETLKESLRQREYELEEAHRIARLGTWRWNFVTDTVTWSKEVFLAFELDPQGPIPRHNHMQSLHTPESWERMIAAVQRIKTDGTPYALDIEIQVADGSRRWIHTRGEVAARGPDGRVTEARGTVQNVTERKLGEMKLRERERELLEIQRIAGVGAWRWIAATDELTWSDELYRIFEWDLEQKPPRIEEHEALMTPESWSRTVELLRKAKDRGESFQFDSELVLPSGVARYITSIGEAVLDVEGNVVELRGTVRDITTRKLSEDALRDTQSRFQKLYEAKLLGMCYPDRHGVFHDGNEEFLRIVGYSRDELEAGLVRWDTMTPPEYAHLDADHIAEAAERGSCTPYEKEYIRKDGTRVPILCGYALLEGSTEEYIGFISDLTPQKEAERAQRESQSRFQKLYDSDLIGIGFPEATGAIPECNDALLRIIGYTREDMLAGLVRWDTMTPPEYREADIAHITEAHERGSCTPYEKEYIRKDGSRVPILCGFARLTAEKNESIGFIMDLSAQKQAEQEVREREMRFRELADSLPQLVWVSDPNGDRTYTNQYYLNYLGLPMDAVLGGRWKNYLHPDDLDRTVKRWTHSMQTGEPYSNEYRIRRHDGHYRSFLVRGVAVRNEAGEIQRWLGSATDIHDQKIAEEALRRTEKLAVTGRLAASIAHEINNPLEAVTNSLYLALQDGALSTETRMYLKMAEQELQRVSQLTTQTLRFHRQSVAAAEADLSELMDSAYALFATRFEACNIDIKREYQPGMMLFCRGDELRQVFANLLSNALDAMRHGGSLRIRIRTGHSWGRDASIGVRVVVCDSGTGIPPELRKKIFEPFISTKVDTGTGLGLWVSEGIVKKHRGRISLYSHTGKGEHGTVFSLFFPLDGINADHGGDLPGQAGDLP